MNLPFFFFNDTATTEIYTLSLHDALPISMSKSTLRPTADESAFMWKKRTASERAFSISMRWAYRVISLTVDRKSTRLNSSHLVISYAVFCLKKKKKKSYEFRELTDTVLVR